jgi:hypothetical protein
MPNNCLSIIANVGIESLGGSPKQNKKFTEDGVRHVSEMFVRFYQITRYDISEHRSVLHT